MTRERCIWAVEVLHGGKWFSVTFHENRRGAGMSSKFYLSFHAPDEIRIVKYIPDTAEVTK